MLDIDVKVKVRIQEIDGEQPPLGADEQFITLRSHDDIESFVVIAIGGAEYSIDGKDLRAATTRCERIG